MLRQVWDLAVLNGFSARADIAPAVRGPLDFSGVDRSKTVFLFGDHGGFLFELSAPGEYEVHVMLTEAGRGRWGFAAAMEARAVMERRGVKRLWARVDPEMRHLALFTRRAGFSKCGEMPPYHIYEWRPECLLQ